jgi:UDPglucose--hexose-1-phosphate uridylyltransferase
VPAPELRIDPLTGLRVVLAPARADRPFSFESSTVHDEAREQCPLCEHHESWTPPETYALRPAGGEPDTPGWLVRAVPNKYPLLEPGEPDAPPDPLGDGRGDPELLVAGHATGHHEVIVHTPEHKASITALDAEQFELAVGGWRERSRAHSDAACVHLMVNEGHAAGASLEHTHAQLYALPFVPAAVARERERAGAYAERTAGGGLLTDVLVEEVRRAERMVAIDEEAALICPWASRSPFELRVLPRREQASFEQDETGAAMIRTALRLLAARFGGPPELNLWVRTAPRGTEVFHWHVDIAPRLTIKAGFELGTGIDINVYPPERAAADLKECL